MPKKKGQRNKHVWHGKNVSLSYKSKIIHDNIPRRDFGDTPIGHNSVGVNFPCVYSTFDILTAC